MALKERQETMPDVRFLSTGDLEFDVPGGSAYELTSQMEPSAMAAGRINIARTVGGAEAYCRLLGTETATGTTAQHEADIFKFITKAIEEYTLFSKYGKGLRRLHLSEDAEEFSTMPSRRYGKIKGRIKFGGRGKMLNDDSPWL